MIQDYIREHAPGIHELSCGTRLDGGYDILLQLECDSKIKPLVITKAEYKTNQWKEIINDAIDEINL